jgi:hypothetical protein
LQPCKPYDLLIWATKPSHTAETLNEVKNFNPTNPHYS